MGILSFRRRVLPACLILLLAAPGAGGAAHAATPSVQHAAIPAGLQQPRCPRQNGDLGATLGGLGGPAGTVYQGTLQSSALHGRTRTYEIYLPPDYRAPAAATRRYPVMYLLHGAPGGPLDWLCSGGAAATADALMRAGHRAPFILVMPDGNGGPLGDTEYVDKFNGRDDEMTYLARDVVGYIDAHYRTRADAAHRALVGFSEGGFGAINVGLHHPEEFGTLASLSGYFVALRSEVFGPNDPFGHGRAFQLANSPYDYVAAVPGVRHLRLLIADSTANAPYTGYALQFNARLTALGIPHTLLLLHPVHGASAHSWIFWATELPTILTFVEQGQ